MKNISPYAIICVGSICYRVWSISGSTVHVMDDQPLPAEYAVNKITATTEPIKGIIHPWELDVLVKEVVLNCGKGGDRSLKIWDPLAHAINHIRRLDDACSKLGRPEDILLELHRIAHRQFPWQTKNALGSNDAGAQDFWGRDGGKNC